MANRKAAIIIIFVLVIALLVAIVYIIYGKIQTSRLLEQQQIAIAAYNQGYNKGLTACPEGITSYNQGVIEAVGTLLERTNDCQITDVKFENFTRYVIDASCIDSACLQTTG